MSPLMANNAIYFYYFASFAERDDHASGLPAAHLDISEGNLQRGFQLDPGASFCSAESYGVLLVFS